MRVLFDEGLDYRLAPSSPTGFEGYSTQWLGYLKHFEKVQRMVGWLIEEHKRVASQLEVQVSPDEKSARPRRSHSSTSYSTPPRTRRREPTCCARAMRTGMWSGCCAPTGD